MNVSTHRVSPAYGWTVFAVCNGSVTRDGPLAMTVLYPRPPLQDAT